MRAKTIKSIISRKVAKWIETIEDKDLREKVSQAVIVTGGCIVSMLMGEEVNDFDLYLRDHDTCLKLAEYYVGKFEAKKKKGISVPLSVFDEDGRIKIIVKSSGIASHEGSELPYQYFEGSPDEQGADYVQEIITDPIKVEDVYQDTEAKALATETKPKAEYKPVLLTTNAITLSDKIQIVVRFYGEPDKIHGNYDFVHCTCYWTSWNNELVLRPLALEAILAKELQYVGSKYPICSMVRVRKFLQRGWKINAGQILKMAMQISELNLKDLKVLEDQLTGVDTAYFVQLLDRLKAKDPEKVDAAYLVEIVDRIF